MNTKLFLNFSVVLFAWCLFLNGQEISAAVLFLTVSFCLFCKGLIRNYWRFTAIASSFTVLFFLLLEHSTIPYFFPGMKLFLFAVSVNAGITLEMISVYEKEKLLPLFLGTSFLMCVFYVIAILLPDEWYSLFTKANLYELISFIFFPYIAVSLFRILSDTVYELSERSLAEHRRS